MSVKEGNGKRRFRNYDPVVAENPTLRELDLYAPAAGEVGTLEIKQTVEDFVADPNVPAVLLCADSRPITDLPAARHP